jgi:hypothetical protein
MIKAADAHELYKKFKDSEPTPYEMGSIESLENYIDNEIRKGNGASGVQIPIDVWNFEVRPDGKMYTSAHAPERRERMTKYLEERYRRGGWKMTQMLNDDYPAADCMELTYKMK